MFKRLKKDRGKILLIFLLEALIVVGALAAAASTRVAQMISEEEARKDFIIYASEVEWGETD